MPAFTRRLGRQPGRASRVAAPPHLLCLEDRLAPAVFNIPNGDIAAFRAAILTANANRESDTINLAAVGTYTFADAADPADGGNALPTILTDTGNSGNFLINGNGATLTRSAAAGTPFFRFFRIATTASVVLNGVALTNGRLDPASTQMGGAILLASRLLILANCQLSGNEAPSGGAFGSSQAGVDEKSIRIDRCSFRGNAATNGGGGAIYGVGSTPLRVYDSSFEGNRASAEGGAIRALTSNLESIMIDGSSFTGNAADGGSGGAIFVRGNTYVSFTTVSGNTSATDGGGIWNEWYLSVTSSTISGNTAAGSTASGGGIFARGHHFYLSASTVHGNRAGSGGGIAYVFDGGLSVLITHSTITDNRAFSAQARGGGISVTGGLNLGHTIVAGNAFEPTVTNGTGPDVACADVISLDFNFIGNGSGATITGHTSATQVGTPAAPLDPRLGPLQNNGGPTFTRLPLPGSPVLDAGYLAYTDAPSTPYRIFPLFDQRGTGFLRGQGDRFDIGAAEAQLTPRVVRVEVNGGSAQRSRVTELTVTFSHLVTLPADPAAAFRLTRTGPGAPADVGLTVSLSGRFWTIARLTFSGVLPESGSLADGNYTLTVLGNQVTGPGGLALDGDRDGQPGGNDVTSFHRLYGDGNGDRRVDVVDLFPFRTTFGRGAVDPLYLAYLDANGDGRVDNADFIQFRNRFGTTLNP